MSWVIWSVNTETGARVGILPINEATWARVQNASGSGQASFIVGDRDSAGMPGRFMTEPVSRTLVFEWAGIPIYAGIIWTRIYDRDASKVTLTFSDPWSILGRRLVAAQSSEGIQKTKLSYGPWSLETQVKRAIQAATAGTMFGLPIALPADVAGTHTRTYEGYHIPSWTDVVTDLMNVKYGPDVDFLPRWSSSGSFEWLLAAGVPTPGLLVFNPGAPQSGVTGLTVTEDATKVANHVIATGEGTEADMKVKSAISGASPYPALVKVVNFSQEKVESVLQARADAELELWKDPTEQWAFSIIAGHDHDTSELRPGVGVRAHVTNDPWLPDVTRNLRLIGFSGSLDPTIQMQFQPMEA